MGIDYQENEKHLLKVFLKELLFNKQNTTNSMSHLNIDDLEIEKQHRVDDPSNYAYLELIIRPECNLKCEYCYIHNYGDKLYPKEERVDNQTILNNIAILLDYIYHKNDLYIRRYDLFSGDLFYDNLIFDIFDIFYKYLYEQHIMYRQIYTIKEKNPVVISIPTNPIFINYEEKVTKLEEYIQKFEDIGVRIYLSISTDGKYCIDQRERNLIATDEFFDKLFTFCKKHDYFYHPMIAADNVENWIQNYDWWKEQIIKYKIPSKDCTGRYLPMMLEVRNDNWTQDKIDTYLKVINHMINDRFYNMCNSNLYDFTGHVFQKNYKLEPILGYDPLSIINDTETQRLLCDIQTAIHIQMNDLTIVPCHRTTYKQFRTAKFVVENNKIVDIEPININLWMTIMNIRRSSLPRCARCTFEPYCICGCLGAQYESNGEIFTPCDSVCEMLKNKYAFILYKYKKLGVLDEAKKLGYLSPQEEVYIDRIQNTPIYLRIEQNYGKYDTTTSNN